MKYSTIIFVPHARARFRKFTVSSRVLLGAAAASGVLLICAVGFGWAFLATARQDRSYRRALAENVRLRSTTRELSRTLQGLSRQLEDFESRTRKLAIVAGLPQQGAGGTGGPLELPGGAGSSRGALLSSRLDALETQFAHRETRIASTPSVAPVRGLLNSSFGARSDPFTGSRAFHSGLDISTQRREPVLATAAGTVVKSGWSGDYGKLVEIAHPTGHRTVYGHLDLVLVREGQRVRRGDRVGLVGSTGRSTAPHLHYEVRVAGRPVNPLEFILDAR